MNAPMKQPVEAIRLPPQAIDAEQAILGGLLLDNAAYDRIVNIVREEDFYRNDHRLVFVHALRLIENNRPADALTVSESLERAGKLNEAGGQAYVGTLAINTPSAANIRRYAEIVRARAILRDLLAFGTELADSALGLQVDPHELLERTEQKLYAMRSATIREDMTDMHALTSKVVERIDMMYSREDKSTLCGLSTGFVDLDRMTGGLEAGDLVIVAARPSMGKTTIAMQMADHIATETQKTVAVFSLEMSEMQLGLRLMATRSQVSMHELRTGTFQESDWGRITIGAGQLAESRIVIDDTGGISPSYVRARARRIARRGDGLAAIVIDYLQLMESSGKAENRQQEITRISRELKAIAKELQVPVIALSQLNRGLEQRQDKRPMMSDLRESGALEQDADIILFIYRDEVYNEDSPRRGIAEIIIAKQRNGPIGKIDLTFLGRLMRFENFAGSYDLDHSPSTPKKARRKSGADHKSLAAGDETNEQR